MRKLRGSLLDSNLRLWTRGSHRLTTARVAELRMGGGLARSDQLIFDRVCIMAIFSRIRERASTATAAVFAVAAFSSTAYAAPTLQVEGGQIADVSPGPSGIRVFKGIPYAAPPVGDLRWRPPQAVPRWDRIRTAIEWGPRCVQSNRLGDLDPLNKRMDEDCLYFNVWTPAKSPDELLPVMVWIHGGSNVNGSGSQPEYDGSNLASKGVVVVTINYRHNR
jgi:acetyl esterase/lipase